MAERPGLVIRTRDFAQSFAFYTEGAGYTVTEQPGDELAIIEVEGQHILIAGPNVDLSEHATTTHRVLRQGIARGSDDVDVEQARWEAWGYRDMVCEQKPWGDRELRLHTPEGLALVYTQAAKRSEAEEIALLAEMGDKLAAALEGLSDAELDRKREENGWSIRQIVHHVSDAHGDYLDELKVGLCIPGSPYGFNLQANHITDAGLHYAERPIAAAVSFFSSGCQVAAELLQLYPNYRELTLLMHDGANPGSTATSQSLGLIISGMVSHALEHIYEIEEIRKANEA